MPGQGSLVGYFPGFPLVNQQPAALPAAAHQPAVAPPNNLFENLPDDIFLKIAEAMPDLTSLASVAVASRPFHRAVKPRLPFIITNAFCEAKFTRVWDGYPEALIIDRLKSYTTSGAPDPPADHWPAYPWNVAGTEPEIPDYSEEDWAPSQNVVCLSRDVLNAMHCRGAGWGQPHEWHSREDASRLHWTVTALAEKFAYESFLLGKESVKARLTTPERRRLEQTLYRIELYFRLRRPAMRLMEEQNRIMSTMADKMDTIMAQIQDAEASFDNTEFEEAEQLRFDAEYAKQNIVRDLYVADTVFVDEFADYEREQLGAIYEFLVRLVVPAHDEMARSSIEWGHGNIPFFDPILSEEKKGYYLTDDSFADEPPDLVSAILGRGLEFVWEVSQARTFDERSRLLADMSPRSRAPHLLPDSLSSNFKDRSLREEMWVSGIDLINEARPGEDTSKSEAGGGDQDHGVLIPRKITAGKNFKGQHSAPRCVWAMATKRWGFPPAKKLYPMHQEAYLARRLGYVFWEGRRLTSIKDLPISQRRLPEEHSNRDFHDIRKNFAERNHLDLLRLIHERDTGGQGRVNRGVRTHFAHIEHKWLKASWKIRSGLYKEGERGCWADAEKYWRKKEEKERAHWDERTNR